MKTDIREYLKKNRLFFDGAFGTYYTRLVGTDTKFAPCEAGNIDHPDVVRKIHKEYVEAGANAIKTNTFSAYASQLGGAYKQEDIVREGVNLAREAVEACNSMDERESSSVYIFGDLGQAPGETAEEMARNYIALSDLLIENGIRHFLFETLSLTDGLMEAASYIRSKIPEAFIIASFGVLTDGYTTDGILFEKQARVLAKSGLFDALGLNCVTSASHMKHLLNRLPISLRKRMAVMPNAGYPVVRGFRTVFEGKAPYFVSGLKDMADDGARILGGCCGTTPDYIRKAIAELSRPVEEADWSDPISDIELEGLTEDKATGQKTESNRLLQKLSQGKKIIAVELDSPLGADSSKFMKGAKELQEAGVDSITIADNPIARARMDATVLACKVKQTLDLDVIPHMTCRDRNANATRSLLLGAYADEIRNVLIVTGDSIPTAKRDEVQKVYQFNSRKLISYVSSLNDELFDEPMTIFGALNVNARNFGIELNRAVEKVKEGATGFLTQPAMTDEAVMNLKHAKEVLRDSAKIIGGIIPVVSEKNGRFMESEISGIHLSEEMIESYHGLEREEAEELAVKYSLLYARKMADYVDGYYLMTPFGRTGLMARIVRELKEM